MKFDPQTHPHSDLTERIIGAAMAVHRALGPGLDEKIYENSLCVEFPEKSIAYTQQEYLPVHYRGKFVGRLVTDLIADSKVVVETKVVNQIIDVHIAQILGYQSISGLQEGFILNFKPLSLEVKRVANIYLKNQ